MRGGMSVQVFRTNRCSTRDLKMGLRKRNCWIRRTPVHACTFNCGGHTSQDHDVYEHMRTSVHTDTCCQVFEKRHSSWVVTPLRQVAAAAGLLQVAVAAIGEPSTSEYGARLHKGTRMHTRTYAHASVFPLLVSILVGMCACLPLSFSR